ncbi:hypothetical protein COEREDRAFT_86911 [Coemansia reversa NRRL 1564]|uniref:Serine-threonine/tyrosine-protein kinase catalytic domain-containing protein n=1 Tax=Coemansia reversa (strain ATCC 12441 / NRRL 1564) TaxID=763665 RepID=A0A2G5BBY2_COERN|nr:hypothetical protein COEREDRAFT_86911 [Coemansia reversa NRRL 1564]|eukprot:PIA16516.1 hypothetical protein COEREDRAFT_86911 [Coemansia reversa NRRL 1564]
MGSQQQTYQRITKTRVFTPPKEVEYIVGFGTSGIVGAINEYEVLKMYKTDDQHSINEINREILIYKILGSHENIIGFIEATERGIKLERMKGNIRTYIESNEVDITDRVKWCDFAGSCSENTEPLVMEDARYTLPRDNYTPNVKSEIFALGSTMYEIMQGKKPYNNLDDEEVEKRYRSQEFPDTSNIQYMGKIINGCWFQEYNSAEEMVQAICLVEAELSGKSA